MTADLFQQTSPFDQAITYPDMVDGEMKLYPQCFSPDESKSYFHRLASNVQWKQETISLYGSRHDVPRLSALYGDAGGNYAYSGIAAKALPYTQEMLQIKQRVEQLSGLSFNCVLVNRYRDGSDSVAWHSDDEAELGQCPSIASVSFGEQRKFQLRHKYLRELKYSLTLPHGSLLLMLAPLQHYWQHQVPKTRRPVGERINLTFRLLQ